MADAAPPPGVRIITATVSQHGAGCPDGGRDARFDGPTVPALVPCASTRCRRGGDRLGMCVRSMVAAALVEQEWSAACRGCTTDDRGLKARCGNHADVSVRIVYTQG